MKSLFRSYVWASKLCVGLKKTEGDIGGKIMKTIIWLFYEKDNCQ